LFARAILNDDQGQNNIFTLTLQIGLIIHLLKGMYPRAPESADAKYLGLVEGPFGINSLPLTGFGGVGYGVCSG
jgi:hypothetical protein